MNESDAYLSEIISKISISPVVKTISVSEKHSGQTYGYIRARLTLINDDFLEIAEYFEIRDNKICVQRYRYQWMDSGRQILRKRWDNTKHFPHLPNFPHHVHMGSEFQVVPGKVMSIIELIELLEQDYRSDCTKK